MKPCWLLATSLALCQTVLLPPLLYPQQQPVGVVTALQGKAQLTRAAQHSDLQFKENIVLRDLIDTREKSLARILFGGKSTVTIRELSRLEVREETLPTGATRSIHELSTGAILVNVARQLMRPGDEVQIRTPNAVAAVRGSTLFAQFIAGLGQGVFTVLSGSVVITPQGQSPVTLAPNQSVTIILSPVTGAVSVSPITTISPAEASQIVQQSAMGPAVTSEANRQQTAQDQLEQASQLASAVVQAVTGTAPTTATTTSATQTLADAYVEGTQSSGSLTTATPPTSLGGGAAVTTAPISPDVSGTTGPLTISGDFLWGGGSLSGTGEITVLSGATLDMSGSSLKVLDGRTLNNAGTTIWRDAGDFYLNTGAAFNNLAGGVFEVQNSQTLGFSSAPAGTFVNTGNFTKTAGTGATTIDVPFSSTASVSIQSGTLVLAGGGASTGSFVGAGTLQVASDYTFSPASSITVSNVGFSSGSVAVQGTYDLVGSSTTVSGGTVNFTGTVGSVGDLTISGGTANFISGETIAPTSLALSGGTLTGTDTITVGGLFNWTGGTMSGAGATNANGGMEISGSSAKVLDTRTLNNTGTANLSGGTLTLSGGALLNSTGLFNNAGSVSIQSGTLVLAGGGASTGSFNVASGAALNFAGGTYNLNAGSSLTGAGSVNVNSGMLNITGDNVNKLTGSLNVTGAQLSATGHLASLSDAATQISPGGTFIKGSGSTFTVNNKDINQLSATVALGGQPADTIAIISDKATSGQIDRVYVPIPGLNQVKVIDAASNALIATIGVGPNPITVVNSPNDDRVFVPNSGSNTVSVIDTHSNTVVATIPVGSFPDWVAFTPDSNRAYVTNTGSNNVSVINVNTNTVLATIAVGAQPGDVAVTPDGAKAYVANSGANTVSVIDTATNNVIATVGVGNCDCGLLITPDSKRVYVGNEGSNNVSVIDTTTDTVIATIPVGTDPSAGAITPDGKRVYVLNEGSNNLSVIDTASNSVIATIPVGTSPNHIVISQDGKRAYVANEGSNNVSVVDTTTNNVIATVNAGTAPSTLALLSSRGLGRLFVINEQSNNVTVIDPTDISNFINVSGGGKLTGSNDLPLLEFNPSTVTTGGRMVNVADAGSSVSVAGPLLKSTNTQFSLDRGILRVRNAGELTSTTTTDAPLIQLTGTTSNASRVDTVFSFASVVESGSKLTLAGPFLNATNTTFTVGTPSQSSTFLLFEEGASIKSTSAEPFVTFNQSALERSTFFLDLRRSLDNVAPAATMELAGPLVSASGSSFTTDREFVAIREKASFTGTGNAPLLQFTNSTFNIGSAALNAGDFFRVDNSTGQSAQGPATVTLAGSLVSDSGSTFNIFSNFLVLLDGSSLTMNTSTDALVQLNASSINTGDATLALASRVDKLPPSMTLSGPLFSATNNTNIVSGSPAGDGPTFLFVGDGATLTGPPKPSGGDAPALISFTNSVLNAQDENSTGNFLSLRRSISAVIPSTVTVGGPLLVASGSEFTVSNFISVSESAKLVGTGTTPLIQSNPSAFSIIGSAFLRLDDSSDVAARFFPGTPGAAEVTLAGPLISGTGSEISMASRFIRVADASTLKSTSSQPFVLLNDSELAMGNDFLGIFRTTGFTGAPPSFSVNGQLLSTTNGSVIFIAGPSADLIDVSGGAKFILASESAPLMQFANASALTISDGAFIRAFSDGLVLVPGAALEFVGAGNAVNINNALVSNATIFGVPVRQTSSAFVSIGPNHGLGSVTLTAPDSVIRADGSGTLVTIDPLLLPSGPFITINANRTLGSTGIALFNIGSVPTSEPIGAQVNPGATVTVTGADDPAQAGLQGQGIAQLVGPVISIANATIDGVTPGSATDLVALGSTSLAIPGPLLQISNSTIDASAGTGRVLFVPAGSILKTFGSEPLITLNPSTVKTNNDLVRVAGIVSLSAQLLKSSGSTFTINNKDLNQVSATIPLGAPPIDSIAVISDKATTGQIDRVYIPLPGSDEVKVIDAATNALIATIGVGSNPRTVVNTPNDDRIFVLNSDSGNVSVIDTHTNAVVATITVGDFPEGVAFTPDSKRAYVTNTHSNNVSVINVDTNTVVTTIAVGAEPAEVAVTPDGTKVYVTNKESSTVSVISRVTNTVIATIPVGSGDHGIVITPDSKKVYVGNQDTDNVSVIDTATNTVIATIPVGMQPSGGAMTRNGKKIYVANELSGNVSVIDTATDTVVATIPVGSFPHSVVISRDSKRVYVANEGSNNISVIDTATDTVVGTINVGANPIALATTFGGRLFKLFVVNGGEDADVTPINTIERADFLEISGGAKLISSTPLPLLEFNPSTVNAGGLVRIENGGSSLNLSGPLVRATDTKFSLDSGVLRVRTGGILGSTTSEPLIQFTGTGPGASTVDTNGRFAGIEDTGSQLTLTGPFLSAANTTFRLGPNASSEGTQPFLVVEEGAVATQSASTQPFISLTDNSTIAHSNHLILLRRSPDNVAAAASMTLSGPLLFVENSSVTTTRNLVDITEKATLTGTGTAPLIQTANSTLTIGEPQPSRLANSFFVVNNNTGQSKQGPATVMLAGPLASDSGSTFKMTDSFLSVVDGSSFSTTSPNPLIQLSGSIVTTDFESIRLSSSTDQIPPSMTLAGALLSATNNTRFNPGGSLVWVADSATLNGPAKPAMGDAPALIQFSNSALCAAPCTNSESLFTLRRSLTPATPTMANLGGPLLSADGSTFNNLTFINVSESASLTGTGTTPLIQSNGSSFTTTIGTFLNVTNFSSIGAPAGTPGPATVNLAGAFLSDTGSTFSIGGRMLNVTAASTLTSTSGGALVNLSGSTLSTANDFTRITNAGSTMTLSGSLLSAGSTLNIGTDPTLSGDILEVSSAGQLGMNSASPVLQFNGGTHTVGTADATANNTPNRIARLQGDTAGAGIDGVTGLGTFRPVTGNGINPAPFAGATNPIGVLLKATGGATLQVNAGAGDVVGGGVFAGNAVQFDRALYEATAPIVEMMGTGTTDATATKLTTAGDALDVFRSRIVSLGSVVNLDNGLITVNNGALINLNGGSQTSVTGDLLSLTNGSKINVVNGPLIKVDGVAPSGTVPAVSTLNVSGALASFGGTGGNQIIVNNNIAVNANRGGPANNQFPVNIGGGGASITIGANPVKNPALGNITINGTGGAGTGVLIQATNGGTVNIVAP